MSDLSGLKAQVSRVHQDVEKIDEEDGKEIELNLDVGNAADMSVHP